MTLLALILSTAFASAPSVQTLDVAAAKKTSYTSEELAGPVPWWVVGGRVVSKAEALDLILREGAVSCASWLMNFSDDKTVPKEDIQNSLFASGNRIPLWKTVSGRPIYMDPRTDFVLSFVCASKNAQGELVEVDSTDFASQFAGIYSFNAF